MAKTSKDKKAAELESHAAHSIKTADLMENLGPFSADPSFTQELRDRAFQWEEQAKRLRDPLQRRGKA